MTQPETNARAAMPLVTAWIDDLRAAFGADLINAQIRAATRDGLPSFHASENGRTVGVPIPPAGSREISVDRIVLESITRRAPKP